MDPKYSISSEYYEQLVTNDTDEVVEEHIKLGESATVRGSYDGN